MLNVYITLPRVSLALTLSYTRFVNYKFDLNNLVANRSPRLACLETNNVKSRLGKNLRNF